MSKNRLMVLGVVITLLAQPIAFAKPAFRGSSVSNVFRASCLSPGAFSSAGFVRDRFGHLIVQLIGIARWGEVFTPPVNLGSTPLIEIVARSEFPNLGPRLFVEFGVLGGTRYTFVFDLTKRSRGSFRITLDAPDISGQTIRNTVPPGVGLLAITVDSTRNLSSGNEVLLNGTLLNGRPVPFDLSATSDACSAD